LAKRKKIKVLNPPLGDNIGASTPVICRRGPDCKKDGCGKQETILIHKEPLPKGPQVFDSKKETEDPVLALCTCGGNMFLDWSKMRFGISARGPGFHGTKFGARRKKDMIARSEKLAKSQWFNHEPIKTGEGMKARNPTPGGPLDPNSRFAKKKTKPTITYKK
jgi:hypothetical protein